MQELTKSEMQKINGGASAVIIGTVVTAIIEVIFKVGESLGNFIRRKTENKMCDI